VCVSGILASKVQRRDSLARFLRNRPTRRELMERNIIPSQTPAERQRDRTMIGYRLNRSVFTLFLIFLYLVLCLPCFDAQFTKYLEIYRKIILPLL